MKQILSSGEGCLDSDQQLQLGLSGHIVSCISQSLHWPSATDLEYYARMFLPSDLAQIVLGSGAVVPSSPKHSPTLIHTRTHILSNMYSHIHTLTYLYTCSHTLTFHECALKCTHMCFQFSFQLHIQFQVKVNPKDNEDTKTKMSNICSCLPQYIILKANLIFARTLSVPTSDYSTHRYQTDL